MKYWFQTYPSNLAFDYENPTADMIRIEDIARSLSGENRYINHTQFPFSVAQHCVLMSELVEPGLRLWALMHDAAEAYTGDIPRPLKLLLGDAIKEIEQRIEAVLFPMFGLDGPIPPAIKLADRRMLATERDQLQGPPAATWESLETVEPFDIIIDPWDSVMAEEMFLREHKALMSEFVS